MPRTWSRPPRLRAGAAALLLAEDASDVLDNEKSQGSCKNSVIIMAGWQKARGGVADSLTSGVLGAGESSRDALLRSA